MRILHSELNIALFVLATFWFTSNKLVNGQGNVQQSEQQKLPQSPEDESIKQQPQPPRQSLHQQTQQQEQQQQQEYNPQTPKEQEIAQQVYEQEKLRLEAKEQLLRDQQMMKEQVELKKRQEEYFLEQERKKVKGPFHDSPNQNENQQGKANPVPAEEPPFLTNDDVGDEEEKDYIVNLHEDEDNELNPLKSQEQVKSVDDSKKVAQEEWNPRSKPVSMMGRPPAGTHYTKVVADSEQKPGSLLPPIAGAGVVEGQEEASDEEPDRTNPSEGSEEPEVKEPAEDPEAERLFQEGEKLINATYFKEYKEAYLYFLQASELKHKKAQEYVAFGHLFGDYLPQNVTKSAELFTQLASQGSPTAQMGLAFMYSAGFHYNSSQAKALIYSTFGALGGDPMAQMMLGYRYYAGIGVESKCETALTYYRKVAMAVADTVTLSGGPVVQRVRLQEEAEHQVQGNSNSMMLDDDLLQYYHFLADKGDTQAQVVLGTLYYQGGKGVHINHQQAYHYFSTAAEGGNGHAMGFLGKMHSEGSPHVKQSNATAYEFYKNSADKNNHVGQAGLGLMYMNGLGVEKDLSKAFRYFSLASDQGSVDGQLQLGVMYFSGVGVRKDYKMATKYFTMASQNGHVLAFYNLAQMHATGTGVLRNCHTAVELFKNVAERGRWAEQLQDAHRQTQELGSHAGLAKYMFLAELGYEVAQSNVAWLLDGGFTEEFGNHETYQRALLQYSRAASQGSTAARLKMGDYHYYGLGTEIDYESAASHYRMASEQQHNAQAMFNLGYMHERGMGLKQDVHLAKRFYDQAAETSVDAHVPVTLALMKLGVLYGMDIFSKEVGMFENVQAVLSLVDPVAILGPEWDLYLASVLAAIIAVVFYARRR